MMSYSPSRLPVPARMYPQTDNPEVTPGRQTQPPMVNPDAAMRPQTQPPPEVMSAGNDPRQRSALIEMLQRAPGAAPQARSPAAGAMNIGAGIMRGFGDGAEIRRRRASAQSVPDTSTV